MPREERTREQLIAELAELERRIAEMEARTLDFERDRAELRAPDELSRVNRCGMSDAVLITDPAGAFLYVSPSVESVFGYSPEHVQSLGNIARILGAEQSESIESASGGGRITVEQSFVDNSGTPRTLRIGLEQVPPRGDAILWTCHDITERVSAERAFQHDPEHYREIVEACSDSICRFLPDTTLTYVNDAFCRSLGRDRAELLGLSFMNFIAEPDREKVKQHLEILDRHNPTGSMEHRVLLPEGEVQWQQRHDRAVFDTRGELIGFLSTAHDITTLKRVEEMLRQANVEYQERLKQLADELKEVNLKLVRQVEKRKKTEKALHKSRVSFRSILRAAPVGIGVYHGAAIGWVSEKLNDMLDYRRTELVGKDPSTLFPTREEFEQVETIIRNYLTLRGTGEVETRFKRKDGTAIDIHLRLVPIDAANHTKGIVFTALDITSRKRYEARIRRLNTVLRAIRSVDHRITREKDRDRLLSGACRILTETLGYLTAWIALTDESRNLVAASQSGAGIEFARMVEQLRRGEWPQCLEQTATQSGVLVTADAAEHCKDCALSKAPKEYAAMCCRLEYGGRLHGFLTVSLPGDLEVDQEEQELFAEVAGDIAYALHRIQREQEYEQAEKSRKRLEDQLRQAQKMEAIGTLAGGIAHDFNNILAAIVGNAEMGLLDVSAESPLRHNFEQVLKAANRASDLVKQILAFSRQTKQDRRAVSIAIIIKECLKLLRPLLPTTIDIRHHIEGDSGQVVADPVQIHQVLMNLSSNAAHAMRKTGGVLEMRLEGVVFAEGDKGFGPRLPPGDYLRLTVSDTGTGIDPKIMDRIFEPYFTTKTAAEGTGIGLAVVHGIVKSHGGAIEVRSEPGRGTTFYIFLPKLADALEPEVVQPGSLPRGHERIMFIDDEKDLVELGQRVLERLGYEVVTETSSREALAEFRRQPDRFDLVITDLTMPKMTGIELAGHIMQARPDIPIVLCTGFSDLVTPEQTASMGIRAFVMKPINMGEIASTVRQLLDDRK